MNEPVHVSEVVAQIRADAEEEWFPDGFMPEEFMALEPEAA